MQRKNEFLLNQAKLYTDRKTFRNDDITVFNDNMDK